MSIRRYLVIAGLCAAGLRPSLSLAAGPKANGTTVILDDLTGAAGSGGMIGGGRTVDGSLGQVGNMGANNGTAASVEGGFFGYTFNRLQLLLQGENPAPGTPLGKTGGAVSVSSGTPFTVSVQITDQDWYPQNIVDSVIVSTSVPLESNFPFSGPLSGAGFLQFGGTMRSPLGSESLFAKDTTNPLVYVGLTQPFQVFAAAASSPTVTINIAPNSVRTTLGGGISGAASDSSAVSSVLVAISSKAANNPTQWRFWNWAANSFNGPLNGPPIFATATLSNPSTPSTNWYVPFPDSQLAPSTSYYIVAMATNPSNNFSIVETTFTFNPFSGAVGSVGDGKGSAFVTANSVSGCAVMLSSVVFTVGNGGIDPGGVIAVHIPSGWTRPVGFTNNSGSNPTAPGFLNIVSTASFTTEINPPTKSSATLGDNWIVYNAANRLNPGQLVSFIYSGFSTGGNARQIFSIMTKGGAVGNLVPISTSPFVTITGGPASQISFNPQDPLSLGSLQSSPTMQIVVTDQCGISTPTPGGISVSLMAGNYAIQDAGAQFFLSGAGVSTGAVSIPAASTSSPSFYFRTAYTGNNFEAMIATANFGTAASFASRYISLFNSSITINGLSVDTGTFSPGVFTATMTGSGFNNPAVINFSLGHAAVPWEVILSTDPLNFTPEIIHRYGLGEPGRSVSWNGINERAGTAATFQFAPPGVYYVKILASGGVVVDQSLRIYVPQTASIYGTVNAAGAGANVFASGPGTNYGNFAVASSSGFFQVFGLQAGTQYNVQATTGVFANGVFSGLNVSSNGVVATVGGTNIGAIPFPTPTLLHVSVSIPNAPSHDVYGGVNVHNLDYTQSSFGALHFSSGSSSSDDGAQSFGSAGSTWTSITMAPGTYTLDVNLPQLSLSTTVTNIVLQAGQTTDVALNLTKQANIYGFVVLPGTTTFGTFVSVQGIKNGDKAPSVFGGTFIGGQFATANPTQGPYQLFGLDPGSWTVSARAQGFISVSSSVYISSNADVGSPAFGGFDLSLTSGAVVVGTITLLGDTSSLDDHQSAVPGFNLFLNAYNPVTFTRSGTQVRMLTNAGVTSSTFSIEGLDAGLNFIQTHVNGFTDTSQGVPVTSAGGTANLFMSANDARIFLTVKLPGSPALSEFRKVAFYQQGSGILPSIKQDMVGTSTVTYSGASATLQSPPLGSGFYRFDAYYPPTGAFQSAAVALTQGATAALTLDLSGSTYTVSGAVSMTGSVSFSSNNYSITVSSVPGLLANAAATSYCLMGSANPITTNTAHMELLPIDSRSSSFISGSLPIAGALGCSSIKFPNAGGNDANPGLAYMAAISSIDGSFAFPGVQPGVYLLRNNAELDNDAEDGDEIPQTRQIVNVTGNVGGLAVKVSGGLVISGNLVLPPQTSVSRTFAVNLLDSLGNMVRSTIVTFNNSNSAAYTLTRVPDGDYAVQVNDLGFPQLYAARPLVVHLQGLNATQKDVSLLRTGIVRGRVGIQQILPGGATGQFLLISRDNAFLLPASFSITAKADPWFQGGRTQAVNTCQVSGAAGAANGGGFCAVALDGNDQFVINNILPGTYDISFQSQNNYADGANGGVNLVSTLIPGIVVGDGRVTDVGTVQLATALQLRGTVSDSLTGSLLPNIPISAIPAVHQIVTGDSPHTVTDQNGAFILTGLDPKVRYYDIIAASREDQNGPVATVSYEQKIVPTIDLSSITALNISVKPAPYSISGQVLTPPGGPALGLPFGNNGLTQPGAVVFVQKSGVVPTITPIADVKVITDRNGNFTVPALTTGTYKMTIASLNYGAFSKGVAITNASLNVGSLTLSFGVTLSGNLRKADGSSPSQDEIETVIAATPNGSEILFGSLNKDVNTRTVTGYTISGFKLSAATATTPSTYQLIFVDAKGTFHAPAEGHYLVFTSTESRTLDITFRQPSPAIISKGKRVGDHFELEFQSSHPLRKKTANDDDLTLIVTTVSAQGALSSLQLSGDRTKINAIYTPSVNESSFTVKLDARSVFSDPDSVDPVNPEFHLLSQATFFVGLDGIQKSLISNFQGGDMIVEGDSGRVTLPSGAFSVDASSTVEVTLQLSRDSLSKLGVSRLAYKSQEEGNMASLRFKPSAYPPELLKAMASVPPSVNPFSGFYNILLPLGIRTALANPVPMTITYSSSTDPNTLNLYWYNAAANAYILQQDVTGAPPVIDAVNHTITINVNHFSTFVMFQTGVNVITGDAFAGTDITVFNFPNPFDLSVKTVNTVHPAGPQTIRGTMIHFAVPPGLSDTASLRIFNVSGERVRTIDLGFITGGSTFYQAWDGRNESGHDVASGVYIGQVKIGNTSRFFKMALIK